MNFPAAKPGTNTDPSPRPSPLRKGRGRIVGRSPTNPLNYGSSRVRDVTASPSPPPREERAGEGRPQ